MIKCAADVLDVLHALDTIGEAVVTREENNLFIRPGMLIMEQSVSFCQKIQPI